VRASAGRAPQVGALEVFADMSFAGLTSGACSWGSLDLKAEGDGEIGTITIGGVAYLVTTDYTDRASVMALTADGIVSTHIAGTAGFPKVILKLGAALDAARYARIVIQEIVAWTDYDADTDAAHSVISKVHAYSGTPSGVMYAGHLQNNGQTRSTVFSSSGLSDNVAVAIGSRHTSDYVREWDIRGRTVHFSEFPGSSFSDPRGSAAHDLVGQPDGTTPAAGSADTFFMDDAQDLGYTSYTSGETGDHPNIAYTKTIKRIRILAQREG